MKKLVRRGRSWVISETMDKLNKTLEEKTDIFNQSSSTTGTEESTKHYFL